MCSCEIQNKGQLQRLMYHLELFTSSTQGRRNLPATEHIKFCKMVGYILGQAEPLTDFYHASQKSFPLNHHIHFYGL